MSKIDCCPHCGGTSGFAYSMTVKNEMLGEWGEQAEAGDSSTTTKGRAQCIDCKQRISWQRAEGREPRRAAIAATTAKGGAK